MDFESPDVERDFPGLYASESGSGKRSQESDFSDESHDRPTKKDLLIGKRKDKKESKKDLGYAALEGESSPEEEPDIKSPCKSKKSKSFKFPTIKEKREKSREKDVKEKEKDKDKEKDKEKDADRDKEKKKESKSKLKLKDKKKIKNSDDTSDATDEMPVFGVPLSIAVERSHCHDGVGIPVLMRDCIDHVQDNGLLVEGIYKVSGVKSKVQQLKRSYNKREIVKLNDYDVPTVTSLLKTFLRELPDPILTADLTPKFEDVVNVKELVAQKQEFSSLLGQLPLCNQTCLTWLMRHFENVVANECQNKMGITALAATFCPILHTSQRVFSALLANCSTFFPLVKLERYIPPLSSGCTILPNTRDSIIAELAKQDSLLNQIHSEMNHGWTIRSDQLWEVQRFITQLKRKLRSIEKAQEVSEELQAKVDVASAPNMAEKVASTSPTVDDKIDFQLQVVRSAEDCALKSGTASDLEERENTSEISLKRASKDETDASACGAGSSEVVSPALPVPETSPVAVAGTAPINPPAPTPASPLATASTSPVTAPVLDQVEHGSSSDIDDGYNESVLHMEYMELLKLKSHLISRISQEQEDIESLRAELNALSNTPLDSTSLNSDGTKATTDSNTQGNSDTDNEVCKTEKEKELTEQNISLIKDRINLVRQIMFEHEACISLRTQLALLSEEAK